MLSWYKIELNKIRTDLDQYLSDRGIFFQPIEQSVKKEKQPRGLMDSFLSAINLGDNLAEDEDYLDEGDDKETFSSPSKRDIEKESLDKYVLGKESTFSETLLQLIDAKGMKDSVVYKKAAVDRRLFSKIRSDINYSPSKKTAISLCIGLELSLSETKKLLEKAGYALSDSTRFDLIIKYMIVHNEYNIHLINIVLREYGEDTL